MEVLKLYQLRYFKEKIRVTGSGEKKNQKTLRKSIDKPKCKWYHSSMTKMTENEMELYEGKLMLE